MGFVARYRRDADTHPYRIGNPLSRKSFCDLGIFVATKFIEERYQVIKVRWFSDGSEIDMASDCLIKIEVYGSQVLTDV